MNLFIGGNFINTFGNKVDILQLIRQVTEEDDTIQGECMDVITREHGDEYSDLEGADDKYATIYDDILYVDGATAVLIFKDLFDNDWDEVIARIAQQIDNYQGGVLKLQANGFEEETAEPVSDVEELPKAKGGSYTPPSRPALPVSELFGETPDWMKEDSVQQAAVASGIRKLPLLKFGGNDIPVLQAEDGEVLYDVEALYFAAYAIQHDNAYIGQLLVRERFSLEVFQDEIRFEDQRVFASVNAIAILHGSLTHTVEFSPIVSDIIAVFEECIELQDSVRTSVEIDLFGNLK